VHKENGFSIAVLLSGREEFSPYYGGAIARWTYEVYSRVREHINVTVFGFPTAKADLYPLPHKTNRAWLAFDIIRKIPKLRRYSAAIYLRPLREWFKTLDVIHIQNRPGWVSILRRLGYEGVIILHMHNPHLSHEPPEFLDRLAHDVDLVAVCSNFLRDQFAPKSEAIAKKTKVIYNGVNTQLFCPKEGLRNNSTIFFVGTLNEGKGALTLVQAYRKLLSRHPQAELIIGGGTGYGLYNETPYVQELKRLSQEIDEQEGGTISFPGYIPHDTELPAFFQKASIFTCPSIVEDALGMVNVEAMACATPVVGSKRGGIPEVLGETGLTVRHNDPTDLAEAITTLLSRPEYRAALGKAARERAVEVFDWKIIADNWVSILDEVSRR
jgi:glycosyltransferase involved in cell wall biosynthesis